MSLNKFTPDIYSLDIAYLLGIYLTDGYVTKESIRLRVVDLDIAERFASIGFTIFAKHPKIYKFKNKSKNGYNNQDFYEVNIFGKKLCSWITELTDTKAKIPDFAYSMNIDWKKEFIAGIIDGDGWCSVQQQSYGPHQKLCWTGWIGFTGQQQSYISQMGDFLDTTGVDYAVSAKQVGTRNTVMLEYRFKNKSFVENGLYFRCKRKQDNLDTIKREKIGQKYNTKTLKSISSND